MSLLALQRVGRGGARRGGEGRERGGEGRGGEGREGKGREQEGAVRRSIWRTSAPNLDRLEHVDKHISVEDFLIVSSSIRSAACAV